MLLLGWLDTGQSAGWVVAWGGSTGGQTNLPPGLTNTVAIEAGDYFNLALQSNGRVAAWGDNSFHQTDIPPDLSNIVAVAAGGAHSLALTADGEIWAWGDSHNGALTLPDFSDAERFVATSAGRFHSLALDQDGVVFAWGDNSEGQGSWMPGVAHGCCWPSIAIAAGSYHNLALKEDGTVVAWGAGGPGTSGSIHFGQSIVPVNLSNVVAVAAGDFHSLALRSNGTVVAWGRSWEGQTSVPPGLSNVVAIGAGSCRSFALKSDGTVAAWGYPLYGYVSFPEGLSNVVAIDAGADHGVAILSDGSPAVTTRSFGRRVFTGHDVLLEVSATGVQPLNYQWQWNGVDLPGATNSTLKLTAVQSNDGGAYTVTVRNSMGRTVSRPIELTPVIRSPVIQNNQTNQQAFWGGKATFRVSAEGSLPMTFQWRFQGVDIPGATNSVLLLEGLHANQAGSYSVSVSNIAGGRLSGPAFLHVSPVAAWGANYYGLTNVPWKLTNAVAIAAGASHNLALRSDGTVFAWGYDSQMTNVPPEVTGVRAIAAGNSHSLALTSNGLVRAWGNNWAGQTSVPNDLSDVVDISAGDHNLALRNDGTLTAWGNNDYGQANTPSDLGYVVAIAAGNSHSVALNDNGTVAAWGDGRFGQKDIPAGLSNVVSVAAGLDHSLALKADGSVVAWGWNNIGQTIVPAGLTNVVAVAAGSRLSMALTDEGRVVQWGDAVASVPPDLAGVIAIAAGSVNLALIGDGSPFITVQPAHRRELTRKAVRLMVMAVGEKPMRFQWRFNGNEIANATNSTLVLPSVAVTDGGSYTVVVSNRLGSAFSRPAVVTPLCDPPHFISQPMNQAVPRLGRTCLQVTVDGSRPLAYQWYLNNLAVAGATNATLAVSNVSFSNAGTYTVAVTSSFGAITSAPAVLALAFDYEFKSPFGPPVWDFSGDYPPPLSATVWQDSAGNIRAEGGLASPGPSSGSVTGDGSSVGFSFYTDLGAGGWITINSYTRGLVTAYGWTTSLSLNPTNRVLTGTRTWTMAWREYQRFLWNWVPVGSKSESVTEPITQALPDSVNRFWKLSMRVVQHGELLTGQAAIALGGTNIIELQVTGANQGSLATLVLQDSLGSSLSLRTLGPDFEIISIEGTIARQQLDFIASSPLLLTINGNGAVKPLRDGQILVHGHEYTAVAMAAPGNLFSNWVINGVAANSPKITFIMSSDTSLVANFVAAPFPELKGTYTGLFYQTNQPAHASAGLISFTVNKSGAFRGRLQQGVAKYPFNGEFDLALSAQTPVARQGTNDIVLRLQLAAGAGQIIGTVSNAAWLSQFFGYRAGFGSRNKATNFQGSYTVILPGAVDPDRGARGHGFARLTVSRSGSATFNGTLGDCSAAIANAPLAANGQWPLYASLYSGQGSLLGWLTLLVASTNDVPGRVLWTKPAGPPGAVDASGFTNVVETLGSRYAPPRSGERALDLATAAVLLEGGGLVEPLTNVIALDVKNNVTVISPNASQLSLVLSPSAGTFSGRCVLGETGKPTMIKGVILQKQNIGAGFFLGTNQNGAVNVIPIP